MILLNQYYKNIIKYNLFNKFNYKNIKNIPKIKKIILDINCQNSDLKILTISLLALELIIGKKGKFIQSKNSNILLKIRKGNLIGCKVSLEKHYLYNFINKIIFEIIPKIKNFSQLLIKKSLTNTKAITFKIVNTLTFTEFEMNYYIFNNLKDLQITLVTDTKTQKELIYLLNSFKLITQRKI